MTTTDRDELITLITRTLPTAPSILADAILHWIETRNSHE